MRSKQLRYGFAALTVVSGFFGCSDPAPPTVRGALSIHLGGPADSSDGRNCQNTADPSASPYLPASLGVQERTATTDPWGDETLRVQNEENGITAKCIVRDNGDGSYNLDVTLKNGATGVGLLGKINADKSGTADISVIAQGHIIEGVLVCDPAKNEKCPVPACTLNANPDVKLDRSRIGKPNLQVTSGAAYIEYNCPQLEVGVGTACSAYGRILVENCDR